MYLNDESIIVGLEPFKFPSDALYSILAPFLIIGCLAFLILYMRIRNQLNLFKTGVVAHGEIVSLVHGSEVPKGLTVHYSYETSRGKTVLGKSFTNDLSILNSKQQGDKVIIFVSETNESKSCLIPKIEVIRNHWEID